MTSEQIEQERQEFEAWVSTFGNDLIDRYPGKDASYKDLSVELAWLGWAVRAAKSAWISVDDRLPEKSGKYLVFKNEPLANGKHLQEISITEYFSDFGQFSKLMFVTHWQPLPEEPPKQIPKG